MPSYSCISGRIKLNMKENYILSSSTLNALSLINIKPLIIKKIYNYLINTTGNVTISRSQMYYVTHKEEHSPG